MAGRFQDSRLVLSGNVGHVALWKGGDCMWDHVRRYMVHDALPETEAQCNKTHKPFEGSSVKEGAD